MNLIKQRKLKPKMEKPIELLEDDWDTIIDVLRTSAVKNKDIINLIKKQAQLWDM
jgi:hypothetical protein